MADQKRWFKVWTSLLVDMDNKTDEQIGRWARLGCRAALVGCAGSVVFDSVAHAAAFLRVSAPEVSAVLGALPSLVIEADKPANGALTVTFKNWQKYQVDSTVAQRVSRLRSKKRREERREKEGPPPKTTLPSVVSSGSPPASGVETPPEAPPREVRSPGPARSPAPRAAPLRSDSPGPIPRRRAGAPRSELPAEWPADLAEVRDFLASVEAPAMLRRPAYWQRIDAWLGDAGSGVGYLDELRNYLAWLESRPPGQRHRNLEAGFRNWLAKAERWRLSDAQTQAIRARTRPRS